MRKLLYPLALIYGLVVRVRNILFDTGILKSTSFSIPVINVGNLIAGGSGKSPHVNYLAMLLKDDYRVAILSRGYGRVTGGFRLVQPEDTAIVVGDEPLQYKKTMEGITVAVSEDRVEGVEHLLKLATPPEVILLDDAFQHRYIKPGLNILLTEFSNLYSDDYLLPAGMLREPISGAKRASVIIVTKCPAGLTTEQQIRIKNQLRINEKQQLFFSYIRYSDHLKMIDGSVLDIKELLNRKVILLAGIANPGILADFIKASSSGMEHIYFKDHHRYSESDIDQVRNKFDKFAGENGIILTTRKDFMRLRDPHLKESLKGLPLAVIDIEIKLIEPGNTKFNQTILNYVKANTRIR